MDGTDYPEAVNAEDDHAFFLTKIAEIDVLLSRNTEDLDAVCTALDGRYVAPKLTSDLLSD